MRETEESAMSWMVIRIMMMRGCAIAAACGRVVICYVVDMLVSVSTMR